MSTESMRYTIAEVIGRKWNARGRSRSCPGASTTCRSDRDLYLLALLKAIQTLSPSFETTGLNVASFSLIDVYVCGTFPSFS
jgi:hypothetical protein